MGLPAGQIVKFVVGGPVSSQDQWSVGIWTSNFVAGMVQADLDDLAAKCLASFQSKFWGAATNPWKRQCAAGTKLTTCKAYFYSASTLQLQSQATIAAVVGTGAAPHPSYTACVFSLHTNLFGRRNRGRSYLPFTGGSIDATTGLMTVLQQDATNFAAWLTDAKVGAWSTSGTKVEDPIVVSQVGAGAANFITSVSVNDIPDTQRGRINKDVPVNNWTHSVP